VSQQQKENIRKELFERLQDKPFWIWNIEEHKLEDIRTDGDCCFNHIIGLPTKEGMEKAIFDYEKILYDSLLDRESYNAAFTINCGQCYATSLTLDRMVEYLQ
jgi:hypothetical protein